MVVIKKQSGFLLLTCMIITAVCSAIVLTAQRQSFWLGQVQQIYVDQQHLQDQLPICIKAIKTVIEQQLGNVTCQKAWCYTDWKVLAKHRCSTGNYQLSGVGQNEEFTYVHASVEIQHQHWRVILRRTIKGSEGWDWVTTQKAL